MLLLFAAPLPRRRLPPEHLRAALRVLHPYQQRDRQEPIKHTRQHGPGRRRVRPPKQRAKDRPPVVIKAVLGVTAIQMPRHILQHIKSPRSIPACVVDVLPQQVVVHVLLEAADGLGEEAGADEEHEVGHADKEGGDDRARDEGVDDERDGGSGLAEGDAADEDDSFHPSRNTVISGSPKSTQRPARPSLSPVSAT